MVVRIVGHDDDTYVKPQLHAPCKESQMYRIHKLEYVTYHALLYESLYFL